MPTNFFLVLLLAVCIRATEIMNATDPRILWSGRRFVNHNSPNDDSVEFDWLGVSFNIAVDKGTYLKASFDMSHTEAGGHTKLRIFLTDGGYPVCVFYYLRYIFFSHNRNRQLALHTKRLHMFCIRSCLRTKYLSILP